MKHKFFTIDGFIENKIFFILFAVIYGLLAIMPTAHFFGGWLLSWGALFVSIFIYALCSLLDLEKYFNLGMMIVSFLFTYPIWSFLFNVVVNMK